MFSLGDVTDMFCFFLALRIYAVRTKAEHYVWDRLFRRYLRFEDHAAMSALICKSERVFDATASSPDLLTSLGWTAKQESFDVSSPTLAEVFRAYLACVKDCMRTAVWAKERLDVYRPVKTVVTSSAERVAEDIKPLEVYDDLGPEDPPFWMRSSKSTVMPYYEFMKTKDFL